MGSKSNPGQFDCFNNAHPDEPMFVLLGRDRMGSALVQLWAAAREATGESADKVSESITCSLAMRDWCRSSGKQPLTVADVLDLLPFDMLAAAIQRRSGIVMMQVQDENGAATIQPHSP